MKARKSGESDAAYIGRLESQNADLKRNNDRIQKWASDLNEAVTLLSTEASTAFQAIAEKASVRSHPAVTETVRLFDYIAHPQWRNTDTPIPHVTFPDNWDLDDEEAWSGDADMQLNAPIAEAMERIEHIRFSAKGHVIEALDQMTNALQKALHDGIQGYKRCHGFKPRALVVPSQRFDDIDERQLRETVSSIGWLALDLAQDMHFANHMLRRDLRAATYRRVCADLYVLSQLPFGLDAPTAIDIKLFEGEAL